MPYAYTPYMLPSDVVKRVYFMQLAGFLDTRVKGVYLPMGVSKNDGSWPLNTRWQRGQRDTLRFSTYSLAFAHTLSLSV